jgi:hypothetical protein
MFDGTTFRQPNVTVLPPQPPEHGGDPQRIHIMIEIVQRQPQRRGYRFDTVTLALLIIALLAALAGCTAAQAQPTSRQSYRQGFVTRYQSDNGWIGNSYEQGGTTFSEFTGPHGETQHCRSWRQGWQTFTECD